MSMDDGTSSCGRGGRGSCECVGEGSTGETGRENSCGGGIGIASPSVERGIQLSGGMWYAGCEGERGASWMGIGIGSSLRAGSGMGIGGESRGGERSCDGEGAFMGVVTVGTGSESAIRATSGTC